jgi:crotonobetainyl-CoA:carnitine CoA-transferase CaiB-like acyl-CoA transferase
VRAGRFENNLLLVAQFIAQHQLTGQAPVPMGDKRTPPWGVYDIFDTQDGGRIFVAVVSDANWQTFCQDFLPAGWSTDERLRTTVQREAARPWLVPEVAAILKQWKTADLCAALEASGLSYGPIRQPYDLLSDPHLQQGGALIPTTMPGGQHVDAAALPIEFDGQKMGKRLDPQPVGAQTRAILRGMGLDEERIASLIAQGVVAA